ncbi:MAG: hypothetical protein KIT72_18155 [Polyangiaceae bacterium]|nr:hypothetical protein [Polyangiaceae bacterium]MCW5792340.1 hypothetical protein [Polyangiaceae bacterium]
MSVANDIPLDDLVDGIVSSHSKEYFREVYSSFNNGNYRAAIVGLWSVAVFDLHAKLCHLRDLFADKVASEVLDDLAQMNRTNPKSSEWETRLVEVAQARVGWIDIPTRDLLKNLQHQRHLAAHPVISAAGELATPSRDEVRAKLRLVLEKLLTVPATATSSLDIRVLEDLAGYSTFLRTKDDVAQFLRSRFLKHMSSTHLERLFRSLWKLVFLTENDDCDINRGINFMALSVVGERISQRPPALIHAEQGYYSRISANSHLLHMLVVFCAETHGVFQALGVDAQVAISGWIGDDLGRWCYATFLSPDIGAHLSAALERVKAGPVNCSVDVQGVVYLMKCCVSSDRLADDVHRLGIELYGASESFSVADARYRHLVEPFVGEWRELRYGEFIDISMANEQVLWRRRARTEYGEVAKLYCERFGRKLSIPDAAVWPCSDEYVEFQKSVFVENDDAGGRTGP